MPKFRVTAPDGKTYEIQAPEGATKEEALAHFKENYKAEEKVEVKDSPLDDALDVAGEFAAGANRTVAGVVDMVPDAVNAGLSLLGVEARVPTLTGALESTGIQGGFMDEGTPRDIVRAVGATVPAAAALKSVVGRNVASVPGAVAEFTGIGSAAPVTRAALPTVVDGIPSPNPKVARDLSLARQDGNLPSFGYKLDDLGNATRDAVQVNAAKKGWRKPIITMASHSSRQTKDYMKAMLNTVEARMNDARWPTRPMDTVGGSLARRIQIVENTRKAAGDKMDDITLGLKDKHVDVSGPVNNFVGELKAIGVQFKDGVPIFNRANFRKNKAVETLVENITDRMLDNPVPDAHEVHLLKKYFDTQIEMVMKKSSAVMDGDVKSAVLTMRKGLDDLLDARFPAYKEVNDVYSETVTALNALRDETGKKIKFDSPNVSRGLGTVARTWLSNNRGAAAFDDAVNLVDAAAKKYATPAQLKKLSDNLIDQVTFASELEQQFKFDAVAPMSHGGDILKNSARATTGRGAAEIGLDYAAKMMEPSDKKKLGAMRAILR